MKKKIR